ncbi:MAG: hypothetical protein GYA14_14910 [Ignavibacteria bacterium]|nr:hypothetical protein [Ignavibacteria bacterium]
MKKLFQPFIMLIVFITLFAMPIPVFAQDVGEEITQINFKESFETLPALAALVLILTGWVSSLIIKLKWDVKLESLTKGWKQYLSWLLGIALAAAGYFLQWGLFIGVAWYYIFIYGIISGLIANGLFKWELLKTILEALKLLPKKIEETEK